MGYGVVFAPEARAQLISIYRHLAGAAGPARALAFSESIVEYCESFTTFPNRGTPRNDLRPGLRTVGFRKRVTIAFTVSRTTITILGVFYGGRDFETVLKEPN